MHWQNISYGREKKNNGKLEYLIIKNIIKMSLLTGKDVYIMLN